MAVSPSYCWSWQRLPEPIRFVIDRFATLCFHRRKGIRNDQACAASGTKRPSDTGQVPVIGGGATLVGWGGEPKNKPSKRLHLTRPREMISHFAVRAPLEPRATMKLWAGL